MFYRRKLILAILEVFGGKLPKINLQKLLFIVASKQAKPAYDFIPYKFGCFSYSATADLKAMVKHGFVSEDETSIWKKDKQSYLSSLNEADRRFVNQIFVRLKDYDADDLMRHTYINYPYYAINSSTAARLLTKEQLAVVNSSRASSTKNVLYTIGYEGV